MHATNQTTIQKERAMKKIFVSHHNSDVGELRKLKDQIARYNVELFLAPDDLQYGANAIDELKRQLTDCLAILHIGNDESKMSNFCDQELGFAIALGKDVIPVLTDNSIDKPWGFIENNQAIKCNGVEEIKFHILQAKFFDHMIKEKRRKFREILGADGFYVSRSYNNNYITLVPDYSWNDSYYLTSFNLLIDNKKVAKVKIGYSGQEIEIHTENMMLGYFTHLGEDMFSAIRYFDNFSLDDEAKNLINSNLNCLAVIDIKRRAVSYKICDQALYDKFKDQEVLNVSLLRSDGWW